jgi:beta-xylosidase
MNKSVASILILSFLSLNIMAQNVHSDNGNGTYTNPLISADFPDPDVIRVGDTCYMVKNKITFFGKKM